ncbi:MAE_28990/MAE_18760 family HEPN-like nuclease [Nocardia nova]|uniref:MAE_28990/MAE_18760 family HEPN-like nuclease n=1 Tax=Nocardia nova TaxID=37330 RepID=UPI0011AFF016|nr:MAE_28990/MAE_18760 family HEPN-like nuclease [Nocardia nova]
MGVRTVSELEDCVDDALAWRKIELSALKALIEQHDHAGASSPAARGLRRAGIAMLYAHWEGYTKEAMQGYVDFVARRRLKLTELNDGLLTTALLHIFHRAKSGDETALESMLRLVRDAGRERAQLPKNQLIDTQSNLRAAVISKLLSGTGLNPETFSLKENLIDRRLCDARNSVAHGRGHFPPVGEFATLHSEVMTMMEILRDNILDAARSEAYRI